MKAAFLLQCCSLSAQDCCSNDFCNDFYVEASYLYWQASGDNFDFLNVDQRDRTNTPVAKSQSNLTQKLPWDSGFKLGFGFDVPCLDLDVKATWTDFRTSGTKNTTLTGVTNPLISYNWPFGYENNTLDEGDVLTAHQKISFNYNTVNLEFGKWIKFDCLKLAFRPHVGLQYLQYEDHRKFGLTIDTGNEGSSGAQDFRFKERFQGYGLRGGFDVALPLFCEFSLVGNVAASIDWGRDKVNFNGESDVGDGYISSVTHHNHTNRSLIDLGIGFRWESILCDCYGVTLELLWEQHQIINGSRLWVYGGNFDAASQPTFDKGGDLSLRGLTVKAGLSF